MLRRKGAAKVAPLDGAGTLVVAKRAAITARGHRIDGQYFPSGLEAVGYLVFMELARLGFASNVRAGASRPKWPLTVAGVPLLTAKGHKMTYSADLGACLDGADRLIDFKGRTNDHPVIDLYNIKRQLVKIATGKEVESWTKADLLRVASDHGVDAKSLARAHKIKW